MGHGTPQATVAVGGGSAIVAEAGDSPSQAARLPVASAVTTMWQPIDVATLISHARFRWPDSKTKFSGEIHFGGWCEIVDPLAQAIAETRDRRGHLVGLAQHAGQGPR